MIGVVQDMTARKEAELALLATTEALKESEEKYRNVFEAKNDPLLLVDAKTRSILDLNPVVSAAVRVYPGRDDEDGPHGSLC